MSEKKNFGWGVVIFLFVVGVASLTMSGKFTFADSTAATTVVCAVIAAGGLVGQKFGEKYGAIVWWVGVPIACLVAYELMLKS